MLSPRTAKCSSSALAIHILEAITMNVKVATNRRTLLVLLVRSIKPPVIIIKLYFECGCEFLISYILREY